jgi:hypothetical protein
MGCGFVLCARAIYITSPPLTEIDCPLMAAAAGPHSQATVSATS